MPERITFPSRVPKAQLETFPKRKNHSTLKRAGLTAAAGLAAAGIGLSKHSGNKQNSSPETKFHIEYLKKDYFVTPAGQDYAAMLEMKKNGGKVNVRAKAGLYDEKGYPVKVIGVTHQGSRIKDGYIVNGPDHYSREQNGEWVKASCSDFEVIENGKGKPVELEKGKDCYVSASYTVETGK